MNSAHIHLITAHTPVFGCLFGLGLLMLGLLRRSEELKRSSLWVFFLAAFFTLPAYWSGHLTAPMLMQGIPAISADLADRHADVALLATIVFLVVGIIALAGFWVFRKANRLPLGFVIGIAVLAVLSAALLGWTANLGGRIRHPEIREVTHPSNGSSND